ncbi:MAG: beta-ketoacyl-[acyl-carrier-protein] synthase family protein [Rhodobacteraceae bacterium]|nr:beta-ketoacyl-[acyl-carrier-protein] synthase family protein [Paracoccaceae bacterium]
MNRVAITGAGTINALGRDVAETFAAFRAGRPGIGPLDIPDVERLHIRIGAAVPGWRPEDHFDAQRLAFLDRHTQFALVAARQAITQAGLAFDAPLGETTGVVLGTAGGGLNTSDESYRAVYGEGRNRVHPFTVPRLMANAAAAQIAIEWGLRGPNFTVATACASSNHAMGLAFQLIRAGSAPVIVTGGAEAMLCFGGLKAWEGLRVMSPEACRPFSANRSGLVQGEGAAVFVFEDWDHARRRGADILAEVAGFSMNADAKDIVVPDQSGAERAMAAALRDAGLGAGEVGYINAHGTGTKLNDKMECAAIRAVFGAAAEQVAVSSTKSMHGHAIGAAGAIEILACLMALREGVVAPTIGYEVPDLDCDLDIVANAARQADIRATISNAFAFGGQNAVLALKRA